MTKMNIFMKQKQTHRKQTRSCQRGGEGGENWEFRNSNYKLVYIGEMHDKVLLYT